MFDFLKAHWSKLALAFACLFAFTTAKGCATVSDLSAKLAACEAKPPEVVTVAAKASQLVKVVYRDGSPCADVTASNESEASATVAQAVPTPCPVPPSIALWLGAGYLGVPYLSAGVQWQAWQVEAKRSLDSWGGEAKYRLLAF